MRSRALRFTLLALYLGLIGGAAYVVWKHESEGLSAAAAARAFDDNARAAARTLLEIKSAQPGYVAAGQGDEFWARRVDALLASSRDALTTLTSLPHSPQSGTELEGARSTLDDFAQMDRRARDYARSSQALLASDLIFSDGIERIDAAVAALDRARAAELDAAGFAVREHRRVMLAVIVGSVVAGALLTIALTPAPRPAAVVIQAKAAASDDPDLPIRLDPPARPAPAPRVAPAPPEPLVAAAPPVPPSIDIEGIASLCVELSRLADMQALPGVLQRAASLLDASGIVVWVADPDGRELAPIAAHGYPPHLVLRMGTIDRNAQNVTAAAFRTGLVQTVRSDASSPGAIAAPLLTPSGPVGVVAAEILPNRDRGDVTRAVASIVAAQLSALIAPPVARTAGKTEAAGA